MKTIVCYNRIGAVMEKKGIRSIDLARGVGVTIVSVSRWRANVRQPEIPMLFKIAEFLKVSPGTLLVRGSGGK
jgi:transcriptional regulator with XRE-family HTH domain